MAEPDPADYWLNRFATAMDKAASAPGEPSRTAYLELARHYWSMHGMVHGRDCCVPAHFPADASPRLQDIILRWAA